MTAIVHSLSRFSHVETRIDLLKVAAAFCGAGVFILLLIATYGLDLSPGFF